MSSGGEVQPRHVPPPTAAIAITSMVFDNNQELLWTGNNVVSSVRPIIEPLASSSPDALVAAIGPTVQRYLTGDVELPG